MAHNADGDPTGELAEGLRTTFGSVGAFRQRFTAAAMLFGSGGDGSS